jgi:hypothetical protein
MFIRKFNSFVRGRFRWLASFVVVFIVISAGCDKGEETVYTPEPEPTELVCLYTKQWQISAFYLNAAGAIADNGLLREYYQSAEDLKLLRLFCTRFHESLNTGEELYIARQTALSLYNFASGREMNDGVKTEWLRSIGVEREYVDPYDGYLDRFTVTGFDPLQVSCENAIYVLEANSFRIPEFGSDTAERVELFLYRDAFGREFINSWLNENAGESISFIEFPRTRTRYRNDGDLEMSYSRADTNVIRLKDTSDHLHRYVYLLMWTRGRWSWSDDGFAEYIAEIVMPFSYSRDFYERGVSEVGFERLFFSEEQSKTAGSLALERYFYFTGNSEILPLDMRAFYDAHAAVMQSELGDTLREEGVGTWLTPLNEIYRMWRPEYLLNPGNVLSLAEAASFIAYLVDAYSFETALMISGQANPDYAAVFGKDYEELYGDWVAYLNR